jgi:hypothetical protein
MCGFIVFNKICRARLWNIACSCTANTVTTDCSRTLLLILCLWRWLFSGLLRRIVWWMFTGVLEVLTAFHHRCDDRSKKLWKRRSVSSRLRRSTFQKTLIFTFAAVRTRLLQLLRSVGRLFNRERKVIGIFTDICHLGVVVTCNVYKLIGLYTDM